MSSTPSYGIKATLKLLEETRNEAAISLLAHGLAVADPTIRESSVRSLLSRRSETALKAIVQRWHLLHEKDKTLLESRWQIFSWPVLSLLKSDNNMDRKNAIQAIVDLSLATGLEPLIRLAIDDTNLLCTTARTAMFQIAAKWGEKARSGQDVPSIRNSMLHVLQQAINQYSDHRCTEVIDAWLAMSSWDDGPLNLLLNNPADSVYSHVMRRLRHSREPLVAELLAGFLPRRSAPPAVFEILAQRPEASLAWHLIERYQGQVDEISRSHLRTMPRFECLFSLPLESTSRMTFTQQLTLAILRTANAASPHVILQSAIDIFRADTVEGPKAAAKLLQLLQGIPLESLAIAFGPTQSPEHVELRFLLELVIPYRNHSCRALAESVDDIFEDITFARLLSQIQHGPQELCIGLANLLLALQLDLKDEISVELSNPSPRRRALTIQAITYLKLVPAYRERLATLIPDTREEVRLAVISALSSDPSIDATRMLQVAQNYPSSVTNEAATIALRHRTDVQPIINTPLPPVETTIYNGVTVSPA
ncbi:MAG: hypothetical protein RLY14_2504 [Planctomycetota bacterium]|jgi:hypothetical protein